jgi:hypothetical protein
MRMITDDRSQKVRQAMQHPSRAAELVWWFPASNEQYRVRGELIFVGNGSKEYDNDSELVNARIQQWQDLSDSARNSFFQKQIPGEVYTPMEDSDAGQEGTLLLSPPDNFLLMLLKPATVDYLRLSVNMYRQVDKFSGNEWVTTRVNP